MNYAGALQIKGKTQKIMSGGNMDIINRTTGKYDRAIKEEKGK